MSYDVQILVNGSRCKQYIHNGRTYIEAKQGSEYTIEIKNNTWQRILAVCSVDGLDVLDGKPAKEENPGYVINGYNALKIDGFRVSNEKVAKFLFDYKGGSYAASKEDGSERNVGVIGVRLFQEKVKPYVPPTVIREEHHHHHHHDYWWNRPWNTPSPTIWSDNLVRGSDITYGSSTTNASGLGDTLDCCDMGAEYERGPVKYSCDNIPTKGSPTKGPSEFLGKFKKLAGTKSSATYGSTKSAGPTRGLSGKVTLCAASAPASQPDPLGFDMGTKWGEAKESRVIEVDFEKGVLALTTNIYYASRQSLIEMGVPLGNEKQVSFPEPFADSKYAKPPKNWQG